MALGGEETVTQEEIADKYPFVMKYIGGEEVKVTEITKQLEKSAAGDPRHTSITLQPRFSKKPEPGSVIEVLHENERDYFNVLPMLKAVKAIFVERTSMPIGIEEMRKAGIVVNPNYLQLLTK